jgi:hypothetical protein
MKWSEVFKTAANRLLSRKMVMFYFVTAAVFFLGLWNKLSSDNIMLALGWLVTSFTAGNIGEWKYRSTNNKTESAINKNG